MKSLHLCLATLALVSTASLRAETEQKAKPDVPPSVLRTYDKNKDGALDEKERAKWQADLAKRRDKYQQERAAMLERYDANKDGKLSADEAAAAKIEMNIARTEQDMVKGKEKAQERMAREAADKELQERLAAAKAAEEKAASEKEAGKKPAEGGSMMMME
ncbi:MAG: hypothetical protein MUE42_00975 [Opitutaceae bacterium]|nr:hypothetical protein [Opitutaceae bacterium]